MVKNMGSQMTTSKRLIFLNLNIGKKLKGETWKIGKE